MTPSEKLGAFLRRLRCMKVTNWSSSSESDEINPDRFIALMEDADVATSKMIADPERHMVVLDIDHEAWLVKSSTPGHYHLYIEVPGGIEGRKYELMLHAMAAAGVLEGGYVKASVSRGYSSVRLPWVKKKKKEEAATNLQVDNVAKKSLLPFYNVHGAYTARQAFQQTVEDFYGVRAARTVQEEMKRRVEAAVDDDNFDFL